VREVERFNVVVAHGRSRLCGRRRRFLGAASLKHVAAAQTYYFTVDDLARKWTLGKYRTG
jgi:hypothetical protein